MHYLFGSPESKLFGLTIFISIVAFQVGYIYLQWLYLKRIEYLYYIAYMVATVWYALSEFEAVFSKPFFSNILPDYHFYVRHLLPMVSLFLYYRFARTFLNLPVTRPILNKWVIRMEYFLLAIGISSTLSIIMGLDPAVEDKIFVGLCFLLAVLSFAIIGTFLRNSVPLTRFAMLGAAFLVLGSVVSVLSFILEKNGYKIYFDPYLPLLVCVIAELLTFTTGLSYKTSLIEKEKVVAEKALVNELQERERILREMHDMRIKIASDLHDDVGATLSSIGMYSEIGRSKPELVPEVLGKISAASNEMIDRMGDIVWSINPSNDSFEKLFSRMYNFSLDYLTAKGIRLHYHVPKGLVKLPLSMEQGKSMFLILKESIHNAVKYADCSEVAFNVTRKNGYVIMQVKDNGKGFDANNIKAYNGNGLKNMRARAAAINGDLKVHSVEGNGTDITLTFNIGSPL